MDNNLFERMLPADGTYSTRPDPTDVGVRNRFEPYPQYSLQAMARKKDVKQILHQVALDAESGTNTLKKCLTRLDVIAYGVGSTVGAGIFVITGQAALTAGPAVVMSFIVASICCLFSALAYAEFAARVPISGSAYTFTYVCLGEAAAWFVGWNLTLEYAISAAAVARGWGSNLNLFFVQIGAPLPSALYNAPVGPFNVSLMSLFICIVCMGVLLLGVKESATVNKITTIVNVCLILFIVILGSFHIDAHNWVTEVTPQQNAQTSCGVSGETSGFFPCGINGVISGAAQVFFAYIGFDSVTTLAEEVADAKKDIPFGVIATLVISTLLYVAAAFVVTGMQPWFALNSDTPLASAFDQVGVHWAATVIAAVTVTALSVNVLCSIFGQPRVFFRMSKDGLLFEAFSRLHPKTQAPVVGIITTGTCAGIIALVMDIGVLSNMISIGTLMAFSTVCIGVITLRIEYPPYPRLPLILAFLYILPCVGLAISLRNLGNIHIAAPIILGIICLGFMFALWRLPRSPPPLTYVCPFVPFLPMLGVFSNVYLIVSLDYWSYIRVAVWTAIGFTIYFLYGIRYSEQGKLERGGSQPVFLDTEESSADHTINSPRTPGYGSFHESNPYSQTDQYQALREQQ